VSDVNGTRKDNVDSPISSHRQDIMIVISSVEFDSVECDDHNGVVEAPLWLPVGWMQQLDSSTRRLGVATSLLFFVNSTG